MFFLMVAALLLVSFLFLFGLWFVIWSFTMNSTEVSKVLAEERFSNVP
jgi:hypothetical protein